MRSYDDGKRQETGGEAALVGLMGVGANHIQRYSERHMGTRQAYRPLPPYRQRHAERQLWVLVKSSKTPKLVTHPV